MAARGAGWCVGALVVGAVLLTSPWSGPKVATGAEGLSGLYAPTSRPGGYVWSGRSLVASDQGASVATSALLWDPSARRAESVEICTVLAEHDPCPRGERRLVRRTSDGGTVTIALTGPRTRSAPSVRYWRAVRLVPADRVGWTRER